MNRIKHLKNVKKIVVKIGTSILTKNDRFDKRIITNFTRQIASLRKKGISVSLVSSGAIGSGMMIMKMTQRPTEMAQLQACAAIGQRYLMQCYEKAFSAQKFSSAQVLLTWEDLAHQKRFMNAKTTLEQLTQWKLVPVINENDTVATDEIRFGDNDRLSSLISILIEADALVILSDTDGVFERLEDGTLGSRIPFVSNLGDEIFSHVRDSKKSYSVGGMRSKLSAVSLSVEAGIPVVVACGRQENVLTDIFSGKDVGTFFAPKKQAHQKNAAWLNHFEKAIKSGSYRV